MNMARCCPKVGWQKELIRQRQGQTRQGLFDREGGVDQPGQKLEGIETMKVNGVRVKLKICSLIQE